MDGVQRSFGKTTWADLTKGQRGIAACATANKCAPEGHNIQVREIRLSAGAEFIVAIAGDIMTMPGLPKKPAAYDVKIGSDGNIQGLF